MPDALCPMPYALCPLPYLRRTHHSLQADLPLPFRGQCMKPFDREELEAVPDGACRTWCAEASRVG